MSEYLKWSEYEESIIYLEGHIWIAKNAWDARQQEIDSLKKQLDEAIKVIEDYSHALSYAEVNLRNCECDQSVGFTCGNCCMSRDYNIHREFLQKMKEIR